MPQIVVEKLIKTYRVAERDAGAWGALKALVAPRHRVVHALEGISFQVEPGEILGYIGPNGAGKSTTIKCLSGVLVPDSGKCEVMGRVPWKQRRAHVSEIGVVFGQRSQLWWDLPVQESFELLGEIYRVPRDLVRSRLEELKGWLELEPLMAVPVRQLSLGQRMRCEVTASLLHAPKVLFLDEPTIGLDASSKLALREFILKLNRERGVTIFLTTHDMDDIQALCRRVLVIAWGGLYLDGTLESLRAKVNNERRLILDFDGDPAGLEGLPVRMVKREGSRLWLGFDPGKVSTPELIARLAERSAVRDLFVEDPPIEEIVDQLYRERGS